MLTKPPPPAGCSPGLCCLEPASAYSVERHSRAPSTQSPLRTNENFIHRLINKCILETFSPCCLSTGWAISLRKMSALPQHCLAMRYLYHPAQRWVGAGSLYSPRSHYQRFWRHHTRGQEICEKMKSFLREGSQERGETPSSVF